MIHTIMARRLATVKAKEPDISVQVTEFPSGKDMYYACIYYGLKRPEDITQISDYMSCEKMIAWLEGFVVGAGCNL